MIKNQRFHIGRFQRDEFATEVYLAKDKIGRRFWKRFDNYPDKAVEFTAQKVGIVCASQHHSGYRAFPIYARDVDV